MTAHQKEQKGDSNSGAGPLARLRAMGFRPFRFGLGLMLLMLLVVAAGWGWIFLFYPPDAPHEPETIPEDGAVVLERDPTFRWPSAHADARFQVLDSQGALVWERYTLDNVVTIPTGLLKPGAEYRWVVLVTNQRDDYGYVAAVERRFRMASAAHAQGVSGSLDVFPGEIIFSTRHLTGHVPLEIVCSQGELEVELPREFARDSGSREYRATGPAGVYFRLKFDQVMAGDSPLNWGPANVRCGDLRLAIPLVPAASFGAYLGALSVGFNPYTDSPSFSNFADSTLAMLTQGTCVGIVFAVQLAFQKASFGPEAQGVPLDNLGALAAVEHLLYSDAVAFRGASDFRDLASRRPEFVRAIMSTIHLENINPANLAGTLKAAMAAPGPEIGAMIDAELRLGRPAVVAGFRLKTRVLKGAGEVGRYAVLDSGHAFLVYRAWHFTKASLYAVYDPNYSYSASSPLSTLLVVPATGRPVYYVNGAPDGVMVRFMMMTASDISGLLGPLTQGVKQGIDAVFSTLDEVGRALTNGARNLMEP